MKYAVFICGGMAGRPMPDYNNITSLSVAEKECIDVLAKFSEIGLVRTSAFAENPSSEKVLFSLLGYNEKKYKGGAFFPLFEMGVIPDKEDIIFRCSLVNLSSDEVYEEKTMLSCRSEYMLEYEFDCIFDEISENLSNDVFEFVKGRNKDIFLIWKKGEEYAGDFSPPEMALSDCIKEYLPKGDFVQPLYDIMKKSSEILEDYSSNALWIWGNSSIPETESFESLFGLKGSVISDVDFARGLGRFAGMEVLSVKDGIVRNIFDEFAKGQDIVFVYTDDMYRMSMKGDFDGKAEKISEFDREVLKPVVQQLKESGEDFGIMLVSDIAVPAYLERSVSDPVPYMIYKSNSKKKGGFSSFDENTAANSDNYIEKPHELISRFISRHG